MIGSHDRIETTDEEQQGIRVFQYARKRFSTLAEVLPPPAAGSVLMLEREHTAREPIDTLVLAQRSRAIENLQQLFSIMMDQDDARVLAYPSSGYSLIRASIEAAAVALWLIHPSTKKTRVLRALQLSHRHTTDARELVRTIGKPDAVRAAEDHTKNVIKRLNELKDSVGPLRQIALGSPPKYTEILKSISHKEAGPASPYALASPLVIWKISSAFIHGSDSVIRALSDIRQLADYEGGIAMFEVTPSLRMIASCASVCVTLLSDLDQRYTHLATHDHAGREITATTA